LLCAEIHALETPMVATNWAVVTSEIKL